MAWSSWGAAWRYGSPEIPFPRPTPGVRTSPTVFSSELLPVAGGLRGGRCRVSISRMGEASGAMARACWHEQQETRGIQVYGCLKWHLCSVCQQDGLQSVFLSVPPLKGEKLQNFQKISMIKNGRSVLGLLEWMQPVTGGSHHPPALPQTPWSTDMPCTGHIQSCSVPHCPPLPLLRDGFHLPCPQRGGCRLCLSPTPICMRIQDSELNFCTSIRFDWKITGLKVIKSNR